MTTARSFVPTSLPWMPPFSASHVVFSPFRKTTFSVLSCTVTDFASALLLVEAFGNLRSIPVTVTNVVATMKMISSTREISIIGMKLIAAIGSSDSSWMSIAVSRLLLSLSRYPVATARFCRRSR